MGNSNFGILKTESGIAPLLIISYNVCPRPKVRFLVFGSKIVP